MPSTLSPKSSPNRRVSEPLSSKMEVNSDLASRKLRGTAIAPTLAKGCVYLDILGAIVQEDRNSIPLVNFQICQQTPQAICPLVQGPITPLPVFKYDGGLLRGNEAPFSYPIPYGHRRLHGMGHLKRGLGGIGITRSFIAWMLMNSTEHPEW